MIGKLGTVLKHDTIMTVAPPGKLRVQGPGTIVLVPSIMRSGTHLLIDSILNNLSAYRRRPLYIDLDQYVRKGLNPESILSAGPYVVKTHFPQVRWPGLLDAVQLIAPTALIVIPRRNPESIVKSNLLFDARSSAESIRSSLVEFDAFWSQYQHLDIEFARLIDRGLYGQEVAKIAEFIGCTLRTPLRYPFTTDEKMKIYIVKALTRLFGKYSPVVNTTISIFKRG